MNLPASYHPSLQKRRRTVYVAGGIATGVIALSIHTFVLAALHIPTPQLQPATGVIAFIESIARIIGALLVCRYAIASLRNRGWSALKASLVPFILFAMFNELLIRLPLMNGVVSEAFTYSLIAGWAKLLPVLAIFVLAAIVAINVKDLRWMLVASVGIWAAMKYIVGQPLKALVAAILSHAAPLSRPEIYSPPYDWHVWVPAYITYAEPVIGTFLLLALMWDRLPGRTTQRGALVLLILLLARGLVIEPWVYALSAMPGTRLTALLSLGQFTLESAVLILLAIGTRVLADEATRIDKTQAAEARGMV